MLSPSFSFDFLSLLACFVTWELVSCKPTLSKETLPDILRLKKIEQKDDSSFPLFTLTKRSKSLFFKRESLPRQFECLIDLRDCNISGLKLINCRCNMRELQPKDIYFVDNDQRGYLPRYWREFV